MRLPGTFTTTIGLAAVCLTGLIAAPAVAQFDTHNTSLYKFYDLGDLGGNNGNDCWGHVSASGREYAIAGVSNAMIFIEVTDPNNPVILETINHTNTLWGDVKVYRDHAYIVNEGGGGIQVVDMTDIDNGNVTHVNTINSPSTSHNIVLDPISGFLYTAGSNGGSATTVIYDLSNPASPVQVGTWPSAYEHDAQAFTYTTGPNAGRQILFGASTSQGLDVIDVTDKSNVFLVARKSYANVAYCHQVWTEDGIHIYINDELDSIQRTTVMDVSDLTAPVVMNDFDTGLGATDHNLYVRDGFIYEANYRSGLRIFDARQDPNDPTEVGYFDTYPGSDASGFDGAWSNFPFFPSGTVLISDISRGFFIVDVSDAIGGKRAANVSLDVVYGTQLGGTLFDLLMPDETHVTAASKFSFTAMEPSLIEVVIGAETAVASPTQLKVTVEAGINHPTGTGKIRLMNWNTGLFEEINVHALGIDEIKIIDEGIDATNRVRAGDGRIELSIKHVVAATFTAVGFESRFDYVNVQVQ